MCPYISNTSIRAKRPDYFLNVMIRLYTFSILILILFLNVQPLVAGNIVVYGTPKEIPEFSLLDQDGKSLTSRGFEKQWSLVFFGYTSCPDVCPTTLSYLESVIGRIRENRDKDDLPVRVIFISLDPIRDTPLKLKEYIGYFGEGFSAATGKDTKVISDLTDGIGINYDFEDAKSGQPILDVSDLSPDRDYLVNHFAGVFIVGPQARITAVVFPPHEVQRLLRVFYFVRKLYDDK